MGRNDRRRSTAGWFTVGVLSTAFATWAWSASAAPGDTDVTFVPISPCRILDTRADSRVGSIGALGADQTVSIDASGDSGECFLPTDATALSLNVTAIGATLPTFVTVWPGGGRPNASSMNPAPGQPPTPNAVVTPVSASGTFQVYNLQGSVDLIIDVNGYYTPTSLRQIQERLAALEGSNVAPSPSGFSARITGYAPGGSITTVSGDATNGLNVEADVRVDVRCPNGSVEIDFVFNVPPGQTRGWSVLCDDVFTGGATVATVRI